MLILILYLFILLAVSLLSLVWLSVTFLTLPDNQKSLEAFVQKVNPGGWWPGKQTKKRKLNPRKLVLILIYPIIPILLFLFIWQFKFGSALIAGIMLCVITLREMTRSASGATI